MADHIPRPVQRRPLAQNTQYQRPLSYLERECGQRAIVISAPVPQTKSKPVECQHRHQKDYGIHPIRGSLRSLDTVWPSIHLVTGCPNTENKRGITCPNNRQKRLPTRCPAAKQAKAAGSISVRIGTNPETGPAGRRMFCRKRATIASAAFNEAFATSARLRYATVRSSFSHR